jgi:Domain of unknown function (DUF4911)
MILVNSPRDMLLGGLIFRRVRVRAREVVFVKGVIEASEGLAVVFAESGGDLTIATSPSQRLELDEILRDLERDAGALVE